MRRVAVTISVVTLLVMAAVGWCSGCPAFTCAVRAAAGGVIAYVLVTVAGRIVTAVAAAAIVRSMPPPPDRNARRERPT
ncbi:MAG TPA: hypothetical protein VFJ30_03715 [Phycisphaerae bacterium]|nr:hypothetical protein [Phycisphaerae bacterium]